MYVRAVSDNDKNIILRRFRGNNDQELLNLEIDSRTVTSLTGNLETNRTTRWYAIRWIDGHHLLVATDHESDFMRVSILSLSGDLQTIDEIEDLKNEYDQATYDQKSLDTYIVNKADGYTNIRSQNNTTKKPMNEENQHDKDNKEFKDE